MNYQQALIQLPLVREASGQKVVTPADVYGICADLASLTQESFHVLTLNARNRLINRHLITLGLVDSSLAHPREIFRAAIGQDGACAIILAHNHPSGDPTPSSEDLRITRQLVEAGRILDVRVLDHVIIGRPDKTGDMQPKGVGYQSLRESGLVDFESKGG